VIKVSESLMQMINSTLVSLNLAFSKIQTKKDKIMQQNRWSTPPSFFYPLQTAEILLDASLLACFSGMFCAALMDSHLRAPLSKEFNHAWVVIGTISLITCFLALIISATYYSFLVHSEPDHPIRGEKSVWSARTKLASLGVLFCGLVFLDLKLTKIFPLFLIAAFFLFMVSKLFLKNGTFSKSVLFLHVFLLLLFALQITAAVAIYLSINGIESTNITSSLLTLGIAASNILIPGVLTKFLIEKNNPVSNNNIGNVEQQPILQ
jgi:hypothetical protein